MPFLIVSSQTFYTSRPCIWLLLLVSGCCLMVSAQNLPNQFNELQYAPAGSGANGGPVLSAAGYPSSEQIREAMLQRQQLQQLQQEEQLRQRAGYPISEQQQQQIRESMLQQQLEQEQQLQQRAGTIPTQAGYAQPFYGQQQQPQQSIAGLTTPLSSANGLVYSATPQAGVGFGGVNGAAPIPFDSANALQYQPVPQGGASPWQQQYAVPQTQQQLQQLQYLNQQPQQQQTIYQLPQQQPPNFYGAGQPLTGATNNFAAVQQQQLDPQQQQQLAALAAAQQPATGIPPQYYALTANPNTAAAGGIEQRALFPQPTPAGAFAPQPQQFVQLQQQQQQQPFLQSGNFPQAQQQFQQPTQFAAQQANNPNINQQNAQYNQQQNQQNQVQQAQQRDQLLKNQASAKAQQELQQQQARDLIAKPAAQLQQLGGQIDFGSIASGGLGGLGGFGGLASGGLGGGFGGIGGIGGISSPFGGAFGGGAGGAAPTTAQYANNAAVPARSIQPASPSASVGGNSGAAPPVPKVTGPETVTNGMLGPPPELRKFIGLDDDFFGALPGAPSIVGNSQTPVANVPPPPPQPAFFPSPSASQQQIVRHSNGDVVVPLSTKSSSRRAEDEQQRQQNEAKKVLDYIELPVNVSTVSIESPSPKSKKSRVRRSLTGQESLDALSNPGGTQLFVNGVHIPLPSQQTPSRPTEPTGAGAVTFQTPPILGFPPFSFVASSRDGNGLVGLGAYSVPQFSPTPQWSQMPRSLPVYDTLMNPPQYLAIRLNATHARVLGYMKITSSIEVGSPPSKMKSMTVEEQTKYHYDGRSPTLRFAINMTDVHGVEHHLTETSSTASQSEKSRVRRSVIGQESPDELTLLSSGGRLFRIVNGVRIPLPNQQPLTVVGLAAPSSYSGPQFNPAPQWSQMPRSLPVYDAQLHPLQSLPTPPTHVRTLPFSEVPSFIDGSPGPQMKSINVEKKIRHYPDGRSPTLRVAINMTDVHGVEHHLTESPDAATGPGNEQIRQPNQQLSSGQTEGVVPSRSNTLRDAVMSQLPLLMPSSPFPSTISSPVGNLFGGPEAAGQWSQLPPPLPSYYDMQPNPPQYLPPPPPPPMLFPPRFTPPTLNYGMRAPPVQQEIITVEKNVTHHTNRTKYVPVFTPSFNEADELNNIAQNTSPSKTEQSMVRSNGSRGFVDSAIPVLYCVALILCCMALLCVALDMRRYRSRTSRSAAVPRDCRTCTLKARSRQNKTLESPPPFVISSAY